MWKLSSLLFIMLLSFIFEGCGYFLGTKKEFHIPDVSKKWKEEIKVDIPSNENIHKLKVRVVGETSAGFSLNNEKFQPGKIDSILHEGDHYWNGYNIEYEPTDINNEGDLYIYLTFFY